MKILRLADSIISPAIANRYVDPKTNNEYFNLTHGTKGPATWKWYAGVSPKYFTIDDDELLFDGDNYNLTPVYKNGVVISDKKENTCYNITIDNDPTNKNDILLLWGIPGRTCKEVTYEISGSVEVVGEGSYGRSRGVNSTCVPAPVLEIFGDCVLNWSGVTIDGNTLTQKISYNYACSKWHIGSIITGEANV